MSRLGRVLLVEEGWHSTMVLARALEDAGVSVTVLSANGSSARCRRRSVHWVSGPRIRSPQFIDHVDRMMAEHTFDRILPLTESAMLRLASAHAAWRDRVFPDVEPWQRELVGNKHTLIEYMAARGVAIPTHVRVTDSTSAAAPPLPFPVVVKRSTGSAGKYVRIVDSEAALAATLRRARVLGGEWIVQELVTSPTFLFGGVFHEGLPLRMYAAEKLDLYPPRTGGATHLRSVHDDALTTAGLRVMSALRWTGFASADFVHASDGYKLLEVNPRMWGSIAGARSAGVDLFGPFLDLLQGVIPNADLAFDGNRECMIFPRYLYSRRHQNIGGLGQALRDLCGEQGRDWLDPRFFVHIVRRLRGLRRISDRM